MATYLQGVTDYIPDYQPFQPDFNFYANVLQTKQNQYDKNYNAINNVYSDIINAPLTHNLNKEKKDKLLKQIDNNLKKVSSLDLSLEQNVNQATQVFRPFYEDQYLMKDMAFTKNAYNVLNRSKSLQNSADDKMASKWWPTGIKAINYQIQDFADASLEQTLNIPNVSYTPYINSVKHYMDMATKLGIKAETKYNVDRNGKKNPYGDITITQKNGQLILPTLNEMFVAEYSKNPQLQDVYRTIAYVERKDWIAQHLDEYNQNKLAAEKAYLQEQYDYLAERANVRNQVAAENLKVTKNKSDKVDASVKKGNVNFKQKVYLEALAGGATVQEAILMSTRALNEKLNTETRTPATQGRSGGLDLNNMDVARMKVDAGRASEEALKDIMKASKAYSNIDAVYEQDLSQVGLARYKSMLRKQEIAYDRNLEAAAKAHQAYIDWGTKIGKFQYKAVDPNNPLAGGYLVNNDDYDKTFERKSSDSGLTTEDPVDLANLNAEMAKDAEGEYQDPFYDAVVTSLYELASSGQISKKELNIILNSSKTSGTTYARNLAIQSGRKIDINSTVGQKLQNLVNSQDPSAFYQATGKYDSVTFDGNGKIYGIRKSDQGVEQLNPNLQQALDQMTEPDMIDFEMAKKQLQIDDMSGEDFASSLFDDPSRVTTTANNNAYDEFMDIYNTWKKDKSKGRSRLKGKHVYSGWNEWLLKNAGSDMSTAWLQENPKLKETILKFEEFHQFQHANEKIYEINSSKIQEGLELELKKKFSNVFEDQDIEKIAEWYKTQYFDGTLMTRKTKDGEVLMRDGKELDWDEIITIDGKNYLGPSVDEFVRSVILPDVLARNQAQIKESVSKIKEGTEWNETKGLSAAQWRELNTYIDNDETMQELEKEYGLGSEPDLINSADYWDLPRGEGLSDVADYRDELAKQWRSSNNAIAKMDSDDIEALTNQMEDVLDKAYAGIVYDPNKETGLLTMINGIQSGPGGKASLGAMFEDRYVNMQDPQSQGFRDFATIIEDLNRITFNQAGNYRVSVTGVQKTESDDEGVFKHDLDPNMAVRLVESLFQKSIKAGDKGEPIKISNSRIAMEDRNTNSITIYPSRSFLEDNIKRVPYTNYDGETDDKAAIVKVIDDIMANGLTFIAPKNEWQNSFITTNKESPLELALNALGEISYDDPYNAGGYKIMKIDGVPGVTHEGVYTLKGLMPDGSVKSITKTLSYGINRGGSTLETIQREMYNAIEQASLRNLQIYRDFYSKGKQAEMEKAESEFGYSVGSQIFKYSND